MGDVDHGQVGAIGGGVRAFGDPRRRRVVLHVDGGQVSPRPAPQPLLGQVTELFGALEDHHVDVGLMGLCGGHLDNARGPVPGTGPAPAVRSAARQHGYQVLLGTLDHGSGP